MGSERLTVRWLAPGGIPHAAIWIAGSSISTASSERFWSGRAFGASERLVTAATALPMIRATTIPTAIALR